MQEILMMRERRRQHILELFEEWEGHSVVALTLNLPGPDKSLFYEALELAVLTFSQILGENVLHEEVRGNAPCFEGFLVVSGDPMELKLKAVEMEENHPWGRLWDLDVYRKLDDPITRSEIGQSPRKCLLCEQPAKECARSQAHSLEELLAKINQLVSDC